MSNVINIFWVKDSIRDFGLWYAIHNYGWKRLFTIWCAYQMLRFDRRRTYAC